MTTEVINNRYELLSQIGQGGMGAVYRAGDRLTGDQIALKRVTAPRNNLIFNSRNDSSDLRYALAREFKVLAALRHPNIISVLDYGFDEDRQPYFTMELIKEHQTITSYSQNRNPQDQATLIIQLLQALAYLHRKNIIHRDLKPENVLVNNNQVKVLDFGLALAREHLEDTSSLVGTVAYMAPEILSGQGASPATDLHAVGVIAYEIFTGQHPFDTRTVQALLTQIAYFTPDVSQVDVRLEIQGVLATLLEKDPRDRYGSAQETMHALADASGTSILYEPPSIRESFLQSAEFVGREPEMASLLGALNHAKDGRGTAWLIGGESGVGKSRLVDEVRTSALVENVLVLRGQAVASAGLPYQLWRDVIRHLLLLHHISDVDVAIFSEIVTDIGAFLGREVPPLSDISGQERQQRLNGAITELFQAVARPILLIMEDLQWSQESLEPLRPLINIIDTLPLMIIGTYRDDDRPGLPAELPGARVLPLQRLDQQEVARLSAAILGEPAASPPVVEFLHRQTEGNTLFLVEVIRTLAEEVDELDQVAYITLPETVFAGGIQQVIRHRLNQVPAADQPLLHLAAANGRELDLALLRYLDETDSLDRWLAVCAEASVLEVQDDRWRFTHDKLRETLLLDNQPEERRQAHRRVAEAIEHLYPNQTERAFVLAYHWANAEEPAKEAYYTVIAGEHQLQRSTYQEAIRLFNRTLILLPDDGTVARKQQRIRLTSQLGEAHLGVTNYDRAQMLFEAAYNDALPLADAAQLARILQQMGVLHVKRGDYPAADEAFNASIAYARQANDEAGLARTLGHLGELKTNTSDYEAAQRYLDESLALTERLSDRATRALTLRSLGKLRYQQGEIDRGRVYIKEAMAIARALGDRYGVARTVNALGVFAATQDDYDSARIHYQEAITIFRQIGDLWGSAVIKNNLAFVNLLDDDLKAAGPLFYQAVRELEAINVVPVMLETLVGLARILVAVDLDDQAAEILGLADNHPAKVADVDTLSRPARDALTSRHSDRQLHQWMGRGARRTVDDVVSEVLDGEEVVLRQLKERTDGTV